MINRRPPSFPGPDQRLRELKERLEAEGVEEEVRLWLPLCCSVELVFTPGSHDASLPHKHAFSVFYFSLSPFPSLSTPFSFPTLNISLKTMCILFFPHPLSNVIYPPESKAFHK